MIRKHECYRLKKNIIHILFFSSWSLNNLPVRTNQENPCPLISLFCIKGGALDPGAERRNWPKFYPPAFYLSLLITEIVHLSGEVSGRIDCAIGLTAKCWQLCSPCLEPVVKLRKVPASGDESQSSG